MSGPSPPVVLVTGATGFLGSAIAAELVGRGCIVRCLVRGNGGEAGARLAAALEGKGASQVTAVPGDLSAPGLGMPPASLETLADGITHVVHCGARVSMALPYKVLHAANVAATGHLLDLAAARGAAFCFVSSMAAVAPGTAGESFELTIPVSGGYAQSKWAADRLVCAAHQEGRLNAVTCRPGRVTADTRTGRSSPDDLLEWIIRTCVRLGAAPDLKTGVRLSPVDWVSEVITGLALRDDSRGHAFHVVSGESIPWAEVIDILEDLGYPASRIPYARWVTAAEGLGPDDPMAVAMARVLAAGPPSFGRDGDPGRARQVLAADYRAPGPARGLLEAALRAWQRDGLLAASVPGR